jgi:hypothetical protein
VIKGKPPQTVSHPEQNWIFGEPRTRRARPHLLLPLLRSRPQRVRQPLRLRVRPRHLRAHAPHLCRQSRLGPGDIRVALPERLAERHPGRPRHRLSRSSCQTIKHASRSAPPLRLHAPLPLGIPVGHALLHRHQCGLGAGPRCSSWAIDSLKARRHTANDSAFRRPAGRHLRSSRASSSTPSAGS